MPISYTESVQSFTLKWSASHMPNNLAVQRSSESQRVLMIGASHKNGFGMVKFQNL